jgi:predicted DNA-binding transcriptional regulator AlpA
LPAVREIDSGVAFPNQGEGCAFFIFGDLPATAEEAALATDQKQTELRAFTINQWCARWGFSRPHFYALRRDGNAPEVIGTGKAQRISLESEQRWLKRQERLARKAG